MNHSLQMEGKHLDKDPKRGRDTMVLHRMLLCCPNPIILHSQPQKQKKTTNPPIFSSLFHKKKK